MITVQCWSGGKDSTASIILEHIHNLPKSKIIFSEVMFDKNGISGEFHEHINFVLNRAIPIFKAWGYEIEILRADKDYLDCFYHIKTKSKHPERNGKYSGFVLGGMCTVSDKLKNAPIRTYLRSIGEDYIQYVGIAADEPRRLTRLTNTNKISLLAKYGYTERMAYNLCNEYGLVSPIYSFSRRGGCWFCPNQTYSSLARLKIHNPDLWNSLKNLSYTENLVSQGFKYTKTFSEVEKRVEEIITQDEYEKAQLTFEI